MDARLSDAAKKRLAGAVTEKCLKSTALVADFLNKRDVDYVILKGASLSYFDRTRWYGDLDILVRREDLERTARMLVDSLGYRFGRMEELDSLKKDGAFNIHDLTLTHESLMPVEIHYKLVNYLDHKGLALLSGKVFLDYNGVKIPCQSKELQLLEIIFHNVYHHFFICDMERWKRDINILVGHYDIDWKKFITILEELDQKELVYLTLRLLERTGGTKLEVDRAVISKLRPRSFTAYLRKPVFMWALYFIWDRLFPPAHILTERFHIRQDSMMFIFAYPANWVRLFFEFFKAVLKSRK